MLVAQVADVFISYSRRDAGFVGRLADRLAAQGRDVFVDVAQIRDGEVFPEVLRDAILAASGFVFVITPNSAASPHCRQELQIALTAGKRIIPLQHVAVPADTLPEALRVRSWVPANTDGSLDDVVERVAAALDHDAEMARAHAHWLVKASAWTDAKEDRALLLRGSELARAEAWLATATNRSPAPTELHHRFVARSRIAAGRRQRAVTGVSLAVAAGAIALVVIAVGARDQARDARAQAQADALAQAAEVQVATQPELALLLARQAARTAPTDAARLALRDALDASPALGRLDPTGSQDCGSATGLPFSPDVAFAPDGTVLAQAACDGSLRIVSAADGSPQQSVPLARHALSVAYSPDGDTIAVGTDAGARLLDGHTLRPLRTLPGGGALEWVTFSPDGQRLGGGGVAGASLWDVTDGRRLSLAAPAGQTVSGVVFLERNRVLAGLSAAPEDPAHGLVVLDATSGRPLRFALRGRSVLALARQPGGTEIAASTIDVDALSRGKQAIAVERLRLPSLRRLAYVVRTRDDGLGDVAFSPDGARLAVARGSSGVDVYAHGARVTRLLGGVGTSAVAFSPDGARLGSYDVAGDAILWDVGDDGRLLHRAPGAIGQLAVDADRVYVSTATGAVLVLDRRTGDVERTLRLSSSRGLETAPQLAVGAGMVAPLSADGAGRAVYDLSAGRRRYEVRYPSAAIADVLAPDARHAMVSGFEDQRTLQPVLVDLSTGGARTLTGLPPECGTGWSVNGQWSADGRQYFGWRDCGTVGVYDVVEGELSSSFRVPGVPLRSAVSADGHWLALAAADGTVSVYSPGRRRVTRTLLGSHEGPPGLDDRPVVAFSSDGNWLLYASGRRVSVFDAQRSWALSRRLPVRGAVTQLAATADAMYVGMADGAIRVFNLCPGCGDADALLAEAGRRRLRAFSAAERSTYLESP